MKQNILDIKKLMNGAAIAGMLTLLVLVILGFRMGIFQSAESFRSFIEKGGLWGIVLFITFQAVQVVIPVLPGSLGCVVGIMAFGPVMGFIYNYLGICLGSLWAFLLARQYGRPLVQKITKPEQFEKYQSWLEKGKRFDTLFAAAIFFPVAPDDFLCFLAGLTKMTVKKFSVIILLGKPAALAAYSFALTMGFEQIMKFLA